LKGNPFSDFYDNQFEGIGSVATAGFVISTSWTFFAPGNKFAKDKNSRFKKL